MTEMSLPHGVQAYKRTAIFDEDTMPAGLRRSHNTKEGVWGKIVVVEGTLRLTMLDDGSVHMLTPDAFGVVHPRQPHEAEPMGPVKFYIEFHSETRAAEADGSPNGVFRAQDFTDGVTR